MASVITPAELKAGVAWGISDTDSDGNQIPDSHVQRMIDSAQAQLERETGLSYGGDEYLTHTDAHRHPVDRNLVFQLTRVPVRTISKVTTNLSGFEVFEVPLSPDGGWLNRPYGETGPVQIVPIMGQVATSGLAKFAIAYQYGLLHEGLLGTWRFTYTHGFKADDVPPDFVRCVELMAGNAFLRQAADQAYGPGVASRSMSMGGVSESLGTTASAMYSTFSATIEANTKEIDAIKRSLRDYYIGPQWVGV